MNPINLSSCRLKTLGVVSLDRKWADWADWAETGRLVCRLLIFSKVLAYKKVGSIGSTMACGSRDPRSNPAWSKLGIFWTNWTNIKPGLMECCNSSVEKCQPVMRSLSSKFVTDIYKKKSVLLTSNKCFYYIFGIALWLLSLLALYPWWDPPKWTP